MIRFPVDPGDIPAVKAARRLHLTLAEFLEKLPELTKRGFPPADPTTGHYCLEAIDQWRWLRHPSLLGLTDQTASKHSRELVRDRINRM